MKNIINLENVNIFIEILKLIFINICTSIIALKLSDKKIKFDYRLIIIVIFINIISIICMILRFRFGHFYSIICSIILLSIVFSKYTNSYIEFSLALLTISLGINYIIFYMSIIISFIPSVLFNLENNYIILMIILVINTLILISFFKNRRIKRGVIFLKSKLKNNYFIFTILNISIIILFSVTILSNYDGIIIDRMIIILMFFSIMMFITIQKSLQIYYKQKLLMQDLDETKRALKLKSNEIKELENEILSFNKMSHSVSHRQKALEFKIKELKKVAEVSSEISLESELKKIKNEILDKSIHIELQKTGVEEIDNMLKYMQSECIKNKIELELQVNGNIHQMVNNFISKEKLEILIADHVKNAIIAIQHSNNEYKNILVRIGNIDEEFSLYIYDTGIEFEKHTLEILGKEPVTTHKDEEGTGMGFMNTFETLEKYNASLIIKEIGKPSKENFTKVLIIKFDKKHEFKILSYR